MLKRTHILFIALCALCVNQALPAQIFFGDVDQDFPLYDSSDPFGIITATNAIALSRSATNTAHAANALGVTATNDAAQALSLGISATNGVAEALALSATATNRSEMAIALAITATNALAGALQSASSTNDLFAAWFGSLFSLTSRWESAYAWGDWHSAVAGKLDSAATNGWETGSHASFLTSAPPQSVVSVNGQTGAVSITAAGIGALTNETDLAALRAYHYGSPDIVESPAEWFVLDGSGTITAFNWSAGRENVVIPWAIGGVPVTAIGDGVFEESGIVSLIAPQTVKTIGGYAFYACTSLTSVSLPQATSIGFGAFAYCTSLPSVSLPQAQTVGAYAFAYCTSLSSVSLPQAQTVGVYAFESCGRLASVHMGRNAPAEAASVFAEITPPPNIYVTNPQATGWGATWNGAPVVRPPLYADTIYQAGELVATTQQVAQAIAAIPASDAYTVRDSTDTNRWWRFEGTQAVQYALGALTTNYTVTLSEDFMETVGNTRPAWTTTNWPFTDGGWSGVFNPEIPSALLAISFGIEAYWFTSELYTFGTFPAVLYPTYNAQGTATVYQHVYYPTNATGNVLGPVPTNLMSQAQVEAWWATVSPGYATTGHVAQAIAAIPVPDLSDRPTFAQIAASNALPYTAWTGTVTPADGTATVAIAHGNMPVLVTDAPCVLTLDPTGYGTAGVSRVSLSYYTGTNSFTFATNIIDYAATPTVDTNGWNSLLIRRVSDGAWKGVGL